MQQGVSCQDLTVRENCHSLWYARKNLCSFETISYNTMILVYLGRAWKLEISYNIFKKHIILGNYVPQITLKAMTKLA